MQQIADWLEKLGMSEYAQRFSENGAGAEASKSARENALHGLA